MMPIRMRGNCRLHCEHDKLPSPWRGPSSEARRREVTPSLRVLSAADLDCSHSLRHGTGWVARDQWIPGERRFVTSRTVAGDAARQKEKRILIVLLSNCRSETFSSWDSLTFQEIACYFATTRGTRLEMCRLVYLDKKKGTKTSGLYFGCRWSQCTPSPN